MDYYDNHMVISEMSNISNIYWSDDYRVTWQESTAGSPMMEDLYTEWN